MKNCNVKKQILLLFIILGITGICNAQQITGYRYWFDGNIGTAIAVSTTATANLNLTASLSIGSLVKGYHTVSLQFKDNVGNYSAPITKRFVSSGYNIAAYDYWWDGSYQGHTLVNFTSAQTVDLSANIIPYNLDPGQHLFAIRFKDLQGNWSVPVQDTVQTTVLISGIKEITSIKNISISPNPAHTSVKITFDGTGNEILTLTVTNVAGKQIQQQVLQNSFAHEEYLINTQNMPAGVYLVKVASEKGTATRKLIVQ